MATAALPVGLTDRWSPQCLPQHAVPVVQFWPWLLVGHMLLDGARGVSLFGTEMVYPPDAFLIGDNLHIPTFTVIEVYSVGVKYLRWHDELVETCRTCPAVSWEVFSLLYSLGVFVYLIDIYRLQPDALHAILSLADPSFLRTVHSVFDIPSDQFIAQSHKLRYN